MALIVLCVWYFACGVGLVLTLVPQSRRERRLRRRGRRVTAVCRGHLNAVDEDRPLRIRCAFRPPSVERGEYEVIVETGQHIPQVGDRVRIVHDPEDLTVAVLADRVGSPGFGRRDIIGFLTVTVLYAALAGCFAAAG
ncbi:DUF3592 domain-containing protein [Streptomyces sp. NPDC050400]|uniref:DUF3592 domain-containing protein n=1 Tax=Streptomyces sp. NPDC050400 TaxID=3365610 RepID=UPI0037A37640